MPAPPPPVEQIEFARTIEGLFMKGLNADTDQVLKAKLKVAGLDFDRTLLPGYPAPLIHKWIQIAAEHLYPDLPLDEALRFVGQRSIPGLEDNLIGRALISGLKLLGPRRSLDRVQRIFRNNGNYQEITSTPISDTSTRLTISYGFGLPGFYQGVFEQCLLLIGAKKVEVKIVPSPPPIVVLEASWAAN